MSLLSIAPDVVSAASGNLENLGSALRNATTSAAGQTIAIPAPAADEVSAAITALLGVHGQEFQAISAKAAVFHDEFVKLLSGGAAQYLNTEVANAKQTLVNALNTPAEALLGHPLIGPGQPSGGGAAAVPAQTITQSFGPFQFSISATPGGVSELVSLNTPLGQLGSLSLNGIPVFPASGGVGLAVNGTGTANTALGPFTWFSATGSEFISPNGVFGASLGGLTPIGYAALSVNGALPGGITGGSLTALGLEFFFQGSQFGVIPQFGNLPPLIF